jgi:hypothetical protein
MTERKNTKTTKPLGRLADCRVVEIGVGSFAECTQWKAVNCSHALAFGYCFLCMHPRVDEIIENTKKALQAAKI